MSAQLSSLIKIKTKYQLTLPTHVRRAVGADIGDFLEVHVANGTIVLTPRSVIDRDLAESLRDIAEGKIHGPFSSVDEFFVSLEKNKPKKLKNKKQ